MKIEKRRKKNKDSNPIGEKAVREFREQKLRFKPEGGAISDTERAMITASLNRMVRNRGLSSKEIVLNRDQHTMIDVNLDDDKLANKQLQLRDKNHSSSSLSKSKTKRPAPFIKVWPGALVLLKKDLLKTRARETYIVVSVDKDDEHKCLIKKANNQLRKENYEVKTNEITLLPNQNIPNEEIILSEPDGQVHQIKKKTRI